MRCRLHRFAKSHNFNCENGEIQQAAFVTFTPHAAMLMYLIRSSLDIHMSTNSITEAEYF